MINIDDLVAWVDKKPLVLMRFDEEYSFTLHVTRQGFEHLTIVRPHEDVKDIKLPTPCLLELRMNEETELYIAVIVRKMPVSTFESRLTIKKLRQLAPSSLKDINSLILNKRRNNAFKEKIPLIPGVACLTPKLSGEIITLLASFSDNHAALETVISLLPNLRFVSNTEWEQGNAIQTALSAFGIQGDQVASSIFIKKGYTSAISLMGAHLYEDNIVHADATQIPGFDKISSDVTGCAVFEKGSERLVVYTANKLPLEEMLGVDLIYVNESKGNIIMIQYKMLEPIGTSDDKDWIFRRDEQLDKEILRMSLPVINSPPTDYRLSNCPFFFKFVKRKFLDKKHQSFILSLEHVKEILDSPTSQGPKGGIRISYEQLNGCYLREADILNLIRSGYVGTHKIESDSLALIIDAVSKGDRAIVLAWQEKLWNNNFVNAP